MATPSHVDLSVLWVPIMPETSKLGDQMVQVGQDATESFGRGSEKLGDKIHDSVAKSKDKLKDVFHRTGSEAADSVADGVKQNSRKVEDAVGDVGAKANSKFKDSVKDVGKELVGAIGPEVKAELGKRLEDVVGGAAKGIFGDEGIGKVIGEGFGAAANSGFSYWIGSIQATLKDTKTAADKTRKAFADFGSGDTLGGVSKLVDGVGKLGIGVKDLPQPVQDVVGKVNEAKAAAEGFADVFTNLPGKIGTVAKSIGELAGPIAALGASVTALWPQEKAGLFDKTDAAGHEDWWKLAGGVGGKFLENKYNQFVHGHGTPGKAPSPGVDMGGVGGIGKGGDVLGSGSDAYDFFSSGKNLPSAASQGGNTVPLVQKPDGTWTSSNPSWAHLIQRESGGNPTVFNNYDSNAQAGDPSQGLFQFTRATWAAHGGLKYGRDPSKATPQQQAEIAANLIRANPSGSDWGAGLSGRESAGGLLAGVGPGGADLGAVPVSSGASDFVGGGGRGVSSASGSAGLGSGPAGSATDPLYVIAAGGGAGGGVAGGGGVSGSRGGTGMPDFIGGAMQGVGLDGSVFHGFGGASNPMNFGITKLGTGLLGMLGGGRGGGMNLSAMEGHHSPLGGIASGHDGATATAGLRHMIGGSGGGVGGGGGNPIAGAIGLATALFSDLSPGPGASSAHADHLIAGMPGSHAAAIANTGSPTKPGSGRGEAVTHNHGDTHIDQSFNVTNHGVQGNGQDEYKAAMNSSNRTAALSSGLLV